MKLGIRLHDLGIRDNVEEIARAAAAEGFQTVQLILHKAFRGALYEPGSLSADYCTGVGNAFKKEGLEIALLGAYFNWFDDKNGAGERKYKEHLEYARFFGTEIVGTEVQSPSARVLINNPDHEKDGVQDQLKKTGEALVRTAERHGVMAGIEGAWFHVLSTPGKVCELVDFLSSDNIALIFDLQNFLHSENFKDQRRVIDEALDGYGKRLKIIHCKDFVVKGNLLVETALGKGLFDYPYLIRRLKEKGHHDIPLIFEGVVGDDIPVSMEYIKRIISE